MCVWFIIDEFLECMCVFMCVCLRTVEFGDWGLVYVRLLPWKWGHWWIWGLTLKSPHFYLIFHRFRGPTSPWQSLVTVPRFEFVRTVCMAFYTIYSAVLRIIHSQDFSKFRLLLNYPMKARLSSFVVLCQLHCESNFDWL